MLESARVVVVDVVVGFAIGGFGKELDESVASVAIGTEDSGGFGVACIVEEKKLAERNASEAGGGVARDDVGGGFVVIVGDFGVEIIFIIIGGDGFDSADDDTLGICKRANEYSENDDHDGKNDNCDNGGASGSKDFTIAFFGARKM